MSLSLTKKRISENINICNEMLGSSETPRKSLEQLLGKFSWAEAAVPFARTHYRHLQRECLEAVGLNKKIILSDQARDLRWWRDNLDRVTGKSIWLSEPDIEIFSDASLSGWGATCNQVTSRGPWSPEEKSKHINELELLAAFNAFKSFISKLSSVTVRIYVDNVTAVAYVNHFGGKKSRACCEVAL